MIEKVMRAVGYQAICARCKTTGPLADTEPSARIRAHFAAWNMTLNGDDYCPKCSFQRPKPEEVKT